LTNFIRINYSRYFSGCIVPMNLKAPVVFFLTLAGKSYAKHGGKVWAERRSRQRSLLLFSLPSSAEDFNQRKVNQFINHPEIFPEFKFQL